MKAFADDKINATKKVKFVLGRIENVGKGDNDGYQHFLLFLQCFQKASDKDSLKVVVWERVKIIIILDQLSRQSIENVGVAFVKGANERNEF